MSSRFRSNPRVATIEKWFGISVGKIRAQARVRPRPLALPTPGQILFITGPSGSGKSTLLCQYRRLIAPARRIEIDRLPLARRPIVDLFRGLSLQETLLILSRVGLAEAHSYVLPPGKLSDGQRWRLRLALAVHHSNRLVARFAGGCVCMLADEFAGLLDPVTTAVVAHALRRMIDANTRLSAIVASSRDDLLQPLKPDLVIRCDFGHMETIPSRFGD